LPRSYFPLQIHTGGVSHKNHPATKCRSPHHQGFAGRVHGQRQVNLKYSLRVLDIVKLYRSDIKAKVVIIKHYQTFFLYTFW